MVNGNPTVSVVMSVYNGEKYLREAVESILNQSFTDFEFIIINDGSSDRSRDIIKSYTDPRIRYLQHKNHGLAYSLNRGIRESSGEYIARMDADDISLPQRLEKQIKFLEKHSDIGIVGTWAIIMTETGEDIYISKMPQDDLEARQLLDQSSPFFHGAVMFRRSLFEVCGPYPDLGGVHIEDWILWHQFATKTKFANIEEILFKYRITPTGALNRTKSEIKKTIAIGYRYIENKRISPENALFLKSLQGTRNQKKREADYWLKCGEMFLAAKKDHLKARSMIKKGLLLYPYTLRGIVNFLFTFLTPEMVTSCKTCWKKMKLPFQKINLISSVL
jgi:glycosyltransferase involved in cell wall biosynthesis